MPNLTTRAWLAVAVAVAGLAAAGVAIAGAQSDDTPRGTDPLSTEELDAAAALARGSNPGESTGLGDDDVVLLVERHLEEKSAPDDRRRADVYVYSYDDDVLTHSLVDLAEGEVVRSRALPGTQLPLVEEEEDRVAEILAGDAEFQQRLATEYRRATGTDLTDSADVVSQPIVFLASNNTAGGTTAEVCGEHRCAQLLMQTADHVVIDLLPVIDLSTGEVLSIDGILS